MNHDKKFFIRAFFKDFNGRIKNVKEIIRLGFKDEGTILALCQLDALSNFRYQPKQGLYKKCFKKLLEDYYSGVQNISAYSEDLYKYFRCAGVHKGRISVMWNVPGSKDKVFSPEGVLSILEECFDKIRKECLDSNKWLHELGSKE